MRRAVAAALLALAALAAPPAAAQPGLLVGAPELDEQTGELVLYVAGRAADLSPAPVTDLQLFIDGQGPLAPVGRDKVLDYDADHPKWTPPFAVGLVYLWCKDAPRAILDGIESLFRHVPGRTAVYPTPYGQGRRQVVTKLTATRMAGGDVADYPQIPGDQMRLEDAVRFNISKLSEDRTPIKLLIIITDGRGPATGKAWGPFSALGQDLRRRGLQVVILGLDAPADMAESAANVAELADTAHARLVTVHRGSDVQAMIESLSEAVASYERVRFELPWLTAHLGGEHRLVTRGQVRGAPARASAVPVSLPRQITNLLLILAAAVLVVVGALVVSVRRRRPAREPAPRSYGGPAPQRREPPAPQPRREIPMTLPRSSPSPPPVVRKETPAPLPRREPPVPVIRNEPPQELRLDEIAAVAEVLRVGAPPGRAVLALARKLGGRTDEVLSDPRLASEGTPALATRGGAARLRDLRRVIAAHPARETFLREVAPIVCGAIRDQTPAREGARRLRARLPVEVWSTVLRLGAEGGLEQAVSAAAPTLPDLGSSTGRTYMREVQRELAVAPASPFVLWLVRVAGPGSAGQSITIRGTTTVGGPGSPTVVAEDDSQLLPNLAEILVDGNDATLTPLSGPVEIDGEAAQQGTPLHDAQTIALGGCLYVVRIVRRGVMLAGMGRGVPSPTQR